LLASFFSLQGNGKNANLGESLFVNYLTLSQKCKLEEVGKENYEKSTSTLPNWNGFRGAVEIDSLPMFISSQA